MYVPSRLLNRIFMIVSTLCCRSNFECFLRCYGRAGHLLLPHGRCLVVFHSGDILIDDLPLNQCTRNVTDKQAIYPWGITFSFCAEVEGYGNLRHVPECG